MEMLVSRGLGRGGGMWRRTAFSGGTGLVAVFGTAVLSEREGEEGEGC